MARGRLRADQRIDNRGRGFVPGGYSYLGPGNNSDRGPPRNANDAVAQDHDASYTEIMEAGGSVYNQWDPSDREFNERLTVNDVPTAIAKGLFGLKNGAHSLGLMDEARSQSNLRGAKKSDQQMAGLRGQNKRRDRDGRDNEDQRSTRRFRTEGTDLEGALIAVGNDPGNDSLLDLPGSSESQDRLGSQQGTLLDDMEVPGQGDGENTTLALGALRAGGGDQSGQSKETPISIPPSITYGLQETHTTILPWDGWVSAVGLDYGTQAKLSIRMNGVSDMIPQNLASPPAAGSVFTTKDIFPSKLSSASARSYWDFPAVMGAGATADEKPWWRDYWFDVYEFYTVLKCHYEIILENPVANSNALNASILVGTQFDSYSDAAGTVGNVMPSATLVEALSYPGMRWFKVDSQSPNEGQNGDSNRTVISGTWMPGMTKRNIVNDGDVKTWTPATAASVPNLKELLTVNFWRHPMAQANTLGNTTGCNVQIKLKYVVQFKDLRLQARYPNAATAGQNIQQNLNNVYTTGDAYQNPMA
uniref:Capsid protein n=1 Tax=Pavo cristatus parvo-like hybrid virus TaxID=2794523 RepID=A0A8A4XED7_9VIRU|nr:MAG: capsid protein [Pavo cristatus parvo-like hybrid virus]